MDAYGNKLEDEDKDDEDKEKNNSDKIKENLKKSSKVYYQEPHA